jgi:hypothetical protein
MITFNKVRFRADIVIMMFVNLSIYPREAIQFQPPLPGLLDLHLRKCLSIRESHGDESARAREEGNVQTAI